LPIAFAESTPPGTTDHGYTIWFSGNAVSATATVSAPSTPAATGRLCWHPVNVTIGVTISNHPAALSNRPATVVPIRPVIEEPT
jgi:hypothetical protein